MKILQIMCHPDYNGEHRVSNILAKIGEEKCTFVNDVRQKKLKINT